VTKEPLTSSLGPSDWSPDGRSLLIARQHADRIGTYLLDVESGKERQITDSGVKDYSAKFSHDGRRIAFHAETENGSDIVICDVDGSNRRALTHEGFHYSPRWSPDDAWLMFSRLNDDGQCDLLALRIADGKIVTLLATGEDEREGRWLY
jgi:Tol biopolymer transport system component